MNDHVHPKGQSKQSECFSLVCISVTFVFSLTPEGAEESI